MINMDIEELIPLADAAAQYPGRRPHRATVFRHALRGISGRKLETVLVGGRRYTSREAILRFVVANDVNGPRPQVSPPGSSRRRVVSRLQQHGF